MYFRIVFIKDNYLQHKNQIGFEKYIQCQ